MTTDKDELLQQARDRNEMSITLNSIQPTLHELKLGLKELYGDRLVKLILFGSHARGEANPDSDIDLLAVLKSPVSQVQEISYMSDLRVKMILEHDELVSIIPITEEDFSKRNVAFLRNIRKEGIEL
ncbi:MAG: nucleotidyltransferase domain-containing protein [Pseudanabaena sp.]